MRARPADEAESRVESGGGRLRRQVLRRYGRRQHTRLKPAEDGPVEGGQWLVVLRAFSPAENYGEVCRAGVET